MLMKSIANTVRRISIAALIVCWTISTINPGLSFAQTASLPVQSSLIKTAMFSSNLFGMRIYPNDPLQLDFLIDQGDGVNLQSEHLKFIKYFLAVLAVPEDQIWVNLSPEEPDRVIPDILRRTDMGQVLLQQDQALKELTALLLSPENDVGKIFWQKWTEISKDSPDHSASLLHKVWIVPDYASVAVKGDHIFITDSRLKILNEDEMHNKDLQRLIQEMIVPALEDSVNHSSTFEPLRQVYRSMILAAWYKRNLKNSFLNIAYKDQMKMGGIDGASETRIQQMYEQYLQNFKSGAYNVIQEDYDPALSQMVVKNYISGGIDVANLSRVIHPDSDGDVLNAMLSELKDPNVYPTRLDVIGKDQAMLKPVKDLMVTVSLMNLLSYLDENGNLDYAGSLERAHQYIRELAGSGVGNIYISGGLYEMPLTDLHHAQGAGERWVFSDNNTCFVRVPGYVTKSQPYPTDPTKHLRDRHGNNFSILGLDIFNSRFSGGQESPKERFKKLTDFAKSLGVKITVDIIPWLAPEAINEKNIHWTKHRKLTDDEKYLVSHGFDQIKNLLRKPENEKNFLRKIGNDYYLIEHFNDGKNLDQVYLNAFLSDVQKYYIEAINNLMDLGANFGRVDLAFHLLSKNLSRVFPGHAGKAEPLFNIFQAVERHALVKGVEFGWFMEAYGSGEDPRTRLYEEKSDKNQIKEILQSATNKRAQVFFYHEMLIKKYENFIKSHETVWGLAYAIDRAIDAALNHHDENLEIELAPIIVFLSNFDEQSLKNMGGPVRSMIKMLILLSHLGVPSMIDWREWMMLSGSAITTAGGINWQIQQITHPYLNAEEWQQLMVEGKQMQILEQLPWRDFIELLQTLITDESRIARQTHAQEPGTEPYPSYFLDYEDKNLRHDFLSLGWQTGEDFHIFVVNARQNPDIKFIDVSLPLALQTKYGKGFVTIPFDDGVWDILVTMKPDGTLIVRHEKKENDRAMMTREMKAPGGIKLDARDLKIRQDGEGDLEWTLPAYLQNINPNDIQGMVPVVSGSVVWNRPQFQK